MTDEGPADTANTHTTDTNEKKQYNIFPPDTMILLLAVIFAIVIVGIVIYRTMHPGSGIQHWYHWDSLGIQEVIISR